MLENDFYNSYDNVIRNTDPEVVAKLTALKLAHEAEPDIFGPSQVNKGADNALEPCAPEAIAAGCSAAILSRCC